MTNDEKYLEPLRSMAAILMKGGGGAPGSAAWCAKRMKFIKQTLAKYKVLTGSKEFDRVISGNRVFNLGRNRTALVAGLKKSAEALRINFECYTSEVRYTDRVLRFPNMTSKNYESPNPSLLYSSATGDPGECGYFPMNAVRWLTSPRKIAALVTETGTDRLTAELFHFGDTARQMSAELFLLSPGRYEFTLERTGIEGKPFEVIGPRTRISFELPPQKLCILKVVQKVKYAKMQRKKVQ